MFSSTSARRLLTSALAAGCLVGTGALVTTAPASAATTHPAVTPSAAAPVISGAAQRITLLGATVTIAGTATAGSEVDIYFHERNGDGYTKRRILTASSKGTFSTTYKANDDYRVYAKGASGQSATVLVAVVPGVAGPTNRVVKKNATYIITGTYLPNENVTVHFHKQGTDAKDYSIARTVHADSKGVWEKPYLASVDYRFIVTGDANDTYNGIYLIQAR